MEMESHPDTIDLRRVVKRYDTPSGPFTALRDVSLSVAGGEFVAVVGKSGSAKSTLINLVTGIDSPSSGEVFVAGTPVHALSQEQLAIWRLCFYHWVIVIELWLWVIGFLVETPPQAHVLVSEDGVHEKQPVDKALGIHDRAGWTWCRGGHRRCSSCSLNVWFGLPAEDVGIRSDADDTGKLGQ
jgi:energy-coupling factor transporter ATP-binding protein EcfA2